MERASALGGLAGLGSSLGDDLVGSGCRSLRGLGGLSDGVLDDAGDKKIQVIKEVRTLTNLGLKEAKDLVEAAPKPVLEKVKKEDADKAKEALEAAGAKVTVK